MVGNDRLEKYRFLSMEAISEVIIFFSFFLILGMQAKKAVFKGLINRSFFEQCRRWIFVMLRTIGLNLLYENRNESKMGCIIRFATSSDRFSYSCTLGQDQ